MPPGNKATFYRMQEQFTNRHHQMLKVGKVNSIDYLDLVWNEEKDVSKDKNQVRQAAYSQCKQSGEGSEFQPIY